jgi:hypothetical protein
MAPGPRSIVSGSKSSFHQFQHFIFPDICIAIPVAILQEFFTAKNRPLSVFPPLFSPEAISFRIFFKNSLSTVCSYPLNQRIEKNGRLKDPCVGGRPVPFHRIFRESAKLRSLCEGKKTGRHRMNLDLALQNNWCYAFSR